MNTVQNEELFEIVLESQVIGILEGVQFKESVKEFIVKHWGKEFLSKNFDILFDEVSLGKKIVIIKLLRDSNTSQIIKRIKKEGLILGNSLALAFATLSAKDNLPKNVYIRSLDEAENLPPAFDGDRKIPSVFITEEGDIFDFCYLKQGFLKGKCFIVFSD